MKYLKLFKLFESDQEDKLYTEIEEDVFNNYGKKYVSFERPEKIRNLIKGDVTFELTMMLDYFGGLNKDKFIILNYDPDEHNESLIRFNLFIFQMEDEWYLVELRSWRRMEKPFKRGIDEYYPTTSGLIRYFECDTSDGLYNLLKDFDVLKDD